MPSINVTATAQPLSMTEMTRLFPAEWVLIGNPVMDEHSLNVLSGIPILHSKDKKEVCYLGRNKIGDYETFTLVFTGKVQPSRKIVSLYSRRRA